MFNPTSQMNPSQDMNFQNTHTNKKLPNPANFKIVKCKNFERGNINSILFVLRFKDFVKQIFF